MSVQSVAVSCRRPFPGHWSISHLLGSNFISHFFSQEYIGPRTELWGTPDVTLTVSETAPSSITFCVLSYRKELIQRNVEPLMP